MWSTEGKKTTSLVWVGLDKCGDQTYLCIRQLIKFNIMISSRPPPPKKKKKKKLLKPNLSKCTFKIF